jgi:hypothetical protein
MYTQASGYGLQAILASVWLARKKMGIQIFYQKGHSAGFPLMTG